jgi:hypothetical protein
MRIRFVAFVIVATACLQVEPVHARYICDDFNLLPSDRLRLEEAAYKLLEPRGIESGTEWYCRTSERAIATFESSRVTGAGRSVRWAEVHCSRQRGPWTCEATERRSLRVKVSVAGEQYRIRSRIPVDMDAETARTIVATAIELAQSIVPTPACHELDGEPTVIRDRVVREFSTDDEQIELELWGSALLLTTSGLGLELREIRTGETAGYELRCWTGGRIIVTA